MGNVIQTSLGQNPARQAALFAGMSLDLLRLSAALHMPMSFITHSVLAVTQVKLHYYEYT